MCNLQDKTIQGISDKTTLRISDTFREFIKALVEEVVINGEPFDAQKKWLRKYSEAEGLNYETIESNLIDLIEAVKEMEEHESKFAERSARALAKECYFSEALVNQLLDYAAEVRTQKEAERKDQEERERKAREEAERKAREERDRIAKEKAQLQKKLDAERKAREETERKAREEAERKTKEEAERKAKEELEKKRTTGELNGHEYVDLGLPSGTLWATCNVGATQPEEYGDYFAWGETSTKNTYNWVPYKYANGNYDKLTKYCSKYNYGNNGFTDGLTKLQTSDDPAAANWGSGWYSPTLAQWEELLANTTNEWTMQNGVSGRLFTAKNDQTLFLPAAGFRRYNVLEAIGLYGDYWSSSLATGNPASAWYFGCDSGRYDMYIGSRNSGLSVRPVRSARQN